MVHVHTQMPKCRVVLFRPLVSRYQQSCGGYTHCVNKSKRNNTQKVHVRRSFVIRTARLTVTHVGFESWRILLAEDAAVDQKEMQNTQNIESFLFSGVWGMCAVLCSCTIHGDVPIQYISSMASSFFAPKSLLHKKKSHQP